MRAISQADTSLSQDLSGFSKSQAGIQITLCFHLSHHIKVKRGPSTLVCGQFYSHVRAKAVISLSFALSSDHRYDFGRLVHKGRLELGR